MDSSSATPVKDGLRESGPGPRAIAPAEDGKPPRYFALDSLRASMMLLGIYLHSVVGYSREGGWPYKDPHPTGVYDWTLGYIHAFRMPLFYVMAGFFAALLTHRRGLKSFVQNRAQRILVPFVVGWTILFPLVMAMSIYAGSINKPNPWGIVCDSMVSGRFLQHLHPLHLWFLEYLLFLYLVQVLALWCARHLVPAGFLTTVNQGMAGAIRSEVIDHFRERILFLPIKIWIRSRAWSHNCHLLGNGRG
jgi:glucans biosynthesis protein C